MGSSVTGVFPPHQLFGVQAYDLAVVAGAVLVLTAIAIAAGYLPPRKASRVSPMVVLRY